MRVQIHRLLDRDRFCRPCRQFREDGRYESAIRAMQATLWCSHCDRVHKRPLFSAHQRAASSATRICVLAEGKAQFCGHLALGWDSIQRGIFPDEHPCRHPDHDPAWYTRLKDSLMGIYNPAYERPRLRLANFDDPGIVDRLRGRAPRPTVMFLLGRLDHGVFVTRAWLQEQLTAQAHVLDKMLCPHVTARDGQLLLPFGPDRCACFQSRPWIDHHGSHYGACCRCMAVKSQSRAGYFLPEGSPTHKYRCFICTAGYEWGRTGSAVYLTIMSLRGIYKKAFPKGSIPLYARTEYWSYALHPESWGLMDDEELRHVAWCDDINCSSRWRWERLSRLLQDDA